MDDDAHEALTERQRAILGIVGEQGFATIEALARHFDVSAQSIRRDIIRLDSEGALQRFHGGAGIGGAGNGGAGGGSVVRLGYAEKRIIASDAKDRIGRAAAARIPDGSAVFLDVGTTVEAVARALRQRASLRVFTTSLPTAAILTGRPEIELFVLGGSVRGADGSLAGAATLAAIDAFRFDVAVIGYSGFDADGALMDFDLEKVAVKQRAMARAATVLAVGDASKFERSALVRIAPPGAVATIVTDALSPRARARFVDGAGLDVVVAA